MNKWFSRKTRESRLLSLIMAAFILQMNLGKIRVPHPTEKVYKDECAFTFDTPESENGLYVCMNTFLGFSKKYVELHYRTSGNAVFLHLRRIKKEVSEAEEDPPKKKPTRLAIGIEGGFNVNSAKKYECEDNNSIVVLPSFDVIPLPEPTLPDIVQQSVFGILAAESAAHIEEAEAMAGTWDGEQRVISRFAENLLQLDSAIKVPPRGWRCELCDKMDNLWMNLTDGKIFCGRRFFDGSGGNNHAVEHYRKTKYPLAVKLGTITPDGGDVYSYPEDDMVIDPHLDKHLAHFGINVSTMKKTDKSMAELEIDINQRIGEWATIQEAGCNLIPLFGPGYTGIANLGNSCYMNSVMQVLFSIPEFKKRFSDIHDDIFERALENPTTDFNVQMAKLGYGLWSGEYSRPPEDPKETHDCQLGIKPVMFKTLIGKGHPEFSTKRQQDAQEYFLHLLNLIERNSRGQTNPADSFKFLMEERIQCHASKKVKYTRRSDYILALPIPPEAAINEAEVAAFEAKKKEFEMKGQKINPDEIVRAKIPLTTCLEAFGAAEQVEDFFSSAIQAKSVALKTSRLATFPNYLMVQLKKFTIGSDWIPQKLDISVDVPNELDISHLRGHGLQPNEKELPESQAITTAEPHFDEELVAQLSEMGFNIEGCKKAVYHTQNTGLEAAMNWIMDHMNDPDFGEPVPQTQGKSKNNFVPDESGIVMIMAMGFSREQACKALKATDNNVERAGDWIFSHTDEIDEMETSCVETVANPEANYADGPGRYRLAAFISHMGTSTMVGHYVCHILKENRWVIYNDNRVALSEQPPKDLAYLYLYQRI